MLCVFFKQKTAYEVRISDWSSDVCSSDLRRARSPGATRAGGGGNGAAGIDRRSRRSGRLHRGTRHSTARDPDRVRSGVERKRELSARTGLTGKAPECARCRYQVAIRTRVEVQDGRARNLHRGCVNFCVEGGVFAFKSVLFLCTADECSLSSSIVAPSESNPCSPPSPDRKSTRLNSSH